MEWAVLLAVAVAAAVLIALPGRGPASLDAAGGAAVGSDIEALLDTRERLAAELRELDEDVAAGRIAPEDRAEARRALAPRLREVTEALRAAGVGGGVS